MPVTVTISVTSRFKNCPIFLSSKLHQTIFKHDCGWEVGKEGGGGGQANGWKGRDGKIDIDRWRDKERGKDR
jgi:hypothetical protein